MKKILLGVIALTSAASFGAQYEHLHGYLELDGKASIEKPVKYKEENGNVVVDGLGDQTDATYKLGAKADLGVFMHKNKEVFAFIGTDLNGTKGVEALKLKETTPYHFGLRWDSEIIDTFNIQLTAAHRRGGEGIAWETKNKLNNETEKVHKVNGIKYAVEKHLAAKGKKLDGTDQGYKLRPTDTFLLSAVLNGKIYNNFELTVAGLYNSADFKNGTHELETYVKTNGTLKENVKIANAEIKHVLNSDNYEEAGKLSGDVKIETKANNALDLTNEAKFTLDHILPKKYEVDGGVVASDKGHNAEVKVLNNAKYTGIKNVELTGDINYKLGIKSRNDKDGKDKGRLTHEPEVKLGVTVKPVKGLILSSNNSNKVVYAHDLNKGKNETKTSKFENQFTTENKVEYRPIDWLEIRGLAKYNLTTNLMEDAVEPIHGHTLLVGAGLAADKEVMGIKVLSSLDGRYLFDALSQEPGKEFRHQGFVWTENKINYDFDENNKLEGKVNLYNYIDLTTVGKDISEDSVSDAFLGNIAVKYTNITGKFTNVVNVDAKYGLETKIPSEVLEQGVVVDFGGTSTFKAKENVDITLSIDNEYNFNELNKDVYDLYIDFIKKASDNKESVLEFAKDYDASKQDSLSNKIGGILSLNKGEITKNSKRELLVKPKLDVKMMYVDGRLTVNPWIGAGFKLNNEGGKEGFALRNIEGKAGIKINYVW